MITQNSTRIKKLFKKPTLTSFLDFFINIKNCIIKYLLNFSKFKNNILLEHSFYSNHFFNKIFPEKDYYINNFRDFFYSNNPFCFADENERKSLLKKLENEFSEYKKKVISKADSILKNKISVLRKEYQFTTNINWFYSFFGNYNWPIKRTNEIKWIINTKNDIDLKFSLRLNYHQDFITLGLVYCLTNDEKYALKYIDLITDWIKKNPPNIGINWIDLLEISHRIISWIIALTFFKNSKSITKDHFKLIAKSLYLQVFYIKLNSNKNSYNHAIGENYTIFLFSKIFKSFRSINKWYKNSSKILIKQITRQIQEDGVHIEQSTNYHRLVLEIFALLLITEPDIIPSKELKLIESMFEFLKYIIKPNGDFPQVGDSDDAHFIPIIFFTNEKNIPQDLLNLGAVLFNRPEFKLKYNDDKIPLILLLLGNDKLKMYEDMEYVSTKYNIKYFAKSGYVVGKSDWTAKANYLFFDMGQFCSGSSGHDHSDISNIIYSFRGKPILIDSGTYMYNIPLSRRILFQSSKAHNIISIDNKNQALISGSWGWEYQPKIKRKFFKEETYLKAIIEHNGYKNFITRRQLIASNNLDEIKIIDLIISTNNYKGKSMISSFFHFPEETSLEISRNIVKINTNLILEKKIDKNIFKIIKGTFPYSPYYGVKKSSQIIEFRINQDFSKCKMFRLIYYLYPKK